MKRHADVCAYVPSVMEVGESRAGNVMFCFAIASSLFDRVLAVQVSSTTEIAIPAGAPGEARQLRTCLCCLPETCAIDHGVADFD